MTKLVIFGGTSEGRKLCEACAYYGVPALYSVVSLDGARPVENMPYIDINIKRLDRTGMFFLLKEHMPSIVIDATHPYAKDASANIYAACTDADVRYVRITRESIEDGDCLLFNNIEELLAWLEHEDGNIFITAGASLAKKLSELPNFRERVWMRILPSLDSLKTCLDLGYSPKRLICMYGPFSEDMNLAMFKGADAKILVTKNSGSQGGFCEKLLAAKKLGIKVAVLSKPYEPAGFSLEKGIDMIMELRN